jgi:hypothetical protein
VTDVASPAALPAQRTPDSSSHHRWAVVASAAIGLPLALFFLLRPETYGSTPNTLDPVFYTGYSINLDDVFAAGGSHYYFASRWSVYYPMRLATTIAGPFAGRLLWRLILAGVILVCLWSSELFAKWTWAQRLLIGTLVLTMPTFVRAFLTDYVEYAVVAFGSCFTILCIRCRPTARSSAVVGLFAGLMVVANPISVAAVVIAGTIATLASTSSLRRRAMAVFVSAMSAGAVVVCGLLFFRFRYHIDNIYQPTIQFMRSYKGEGAVDPWKSPSLGWLGRFTWIYSVPVVLAGAIVVGRRRKITWTRLELTALAVCALQYTFQWFDQFGRGGYGLELPFYWSFHYPSLALAIAVVVGRLVSDSRVAVHLGLGAAWLLLLHFGVPRLLRFPPGLGFFVIAAAVVTVVWLMARKQPVFSVTVLIILACWTQIGAPSYHPSPGTVQDVSPRYDGLFGADPTLSEEIYDQGLWFLKQMDHVPRDWSTTFVPSGGWSSAIFGLYAAHVTNHLINLSPVSGFSPVNIAEMRAGKRPFLAFMGPPSDVERSVHALDGRIPPPRAIVDAVSPTALGYRLVVLQLPDSSQLPFTWTGDALSMGTGTVARDTTAVAEGTSPGNVVYGPYLEAAPDEYSVTLVYSATGSEANSGHFDVFNITTGSIASTSLGGTDGRTGTVTLSVRLQTAGPWEFRAFRDLPVGLVVSSITLARSR